MLGVLSTFVILTKVPVMVLRFFLPPVSAFMHGSLLVLWIAAASFQAGSDTTDSRHPQHGPPWYITKSCSVAYSESNVGYCQQAKALFAFTVIIIVIYFAETVLAIMSCFVSKEDRAAWERRQEEKREEKDAEDRAMREYEEIVNSPAFPPPAMPGAVYTPGLTPYPMASPHPMASPFLQTNFFHNPAQYQSLNDISPSSASDLPFRNLDTQKPSLSGSNRVSVNVSDVGEQQQQQQQQPYFPPPPKKASK